MDLTAFEDLEAISRADPDISSRSKWNDDIWYLDGFLPGYASATMGWDFPMPEEMLDVFKLVAVALLLAPDAPYHHRSSQAIRVTFGYLAKFMLADEAKPTTLGDLDESAFERYRSAIARVVSRPSENPSAFADVQQADGEMSSDQPGASKLGADGLATSPEPAAEGAPDFADEHGAVKEQADPLTISIATLHLRGWLFLRQAGPTLEAFGIEAPFDPIGTGSIAALAEGIAKKGLDDVEPLPDGVAIPILNAAMRLLGGPANDVMRLQREFLEIRGRETRTRPRICKLRQLITDFEFSRLEGEEGPWHAPITLRTPMANGGPEIRNLVRRIHMAALVMLMAGTGMRISEICSIEVDDREIDDTLPSCIRIEGSRLGASDHFLLDAYLSKNQPEPKPDTWLLGARPRMASWEPAAVRAARVLEELLQPWRRMASHPALRRQLQVSSYSSGIPNSSDSIRWIRAITLRHLAKDFYAEIGLTEILGEAAAADQRLMAYAISNGRCIHHHQWRHTYYEFMVRLDPRLLPAVSLHFKHTTLAATERGYGSKDAAIRDARDAIRVRETVRSFVRRRFGEVRPVGNLARQLELERAALERIVGDVPGAAAEKRVEAFVVEEDVRVWPAEHGDCLMSLNPDRAACRKVGNSVDFRASAPDFTMRTPDLCSGCPNFSVGKEHAPFWLERYAENRGIWIESGRNPLFRVALRNAAQAAAMLRALGQPLPLILRKPPDGSSAAGRSRPG